jgi:hypothetical protein
MPKAIFERIFKVISPQHVWIVDSGTDRVYQYTSAAARTSGSQSAATSFALAPGNSNPQGIADPPVSAVAVSAVAAVSRIVSAPIEIPSWSTSKSNRNHAPDRRPAHAAFPRAGISGDLNLLAQSNLDTRRWNNKPWQRHERFTRPEAVDVALEGLDDSAWPELLGGINSKKGLLEPGH